jgi:hypothetical protein
MHCDSCQRRKPSHGFHAPLGDVEELTEPFQVTGIVSLLGKTNTRDIRKVTPSELLIKQAIIKNYYIQKIRACLSYFSA